MCQPDLIIADVTLLILLAKYYYLRKNVALLEECGRLHIISKTASEYNQH